MRRCAWLWTIVVAVAACSSSGTSPRDGAVTSVGGGKTAVSDGGGAAGRGGVGDHDGGRFSPGDASGSGAGGSSGLCAGQGASCETSPCCGDLHCCSTATNRTCESVCDAS